MAGDEGVMYVGGCVCCVGVLLCLILLPMSFASIAEEELGLRKHSISKKVLFDELYKPGHHNTGPSYGFEKVNRHIHALIVQDSAAWTCPEDEDGGCLDRSNTTDNSIGQVIYSTFTVLYRIIQQIEDVEKAYQSYQFSDGAVERAVRALAKENSKQNPQQYTLQEIIDAHLIYNVTQVIVHEPTLNEAMADFGYQLFRVIVTEIDMGDTVQQKYLRIETNRYEDEIIQVNDQAQDIQRLTDLETEKINNEGRTEKTAINSYSNAYANRLTADIDVYRREAEKNGTVEMIEMYQEKFPLSGVTDIMAIVSSTQYMDQLQTMASNSKVDKIFLDEVNGLNIQT